MHHLFRLRHLGILTAVIGVGLIPLYAAPNLGAGENFAVLANTVIVTGDGTVNVNALNPGGGNGIVGSVNPASIDPLATVNFAATSAGAAAAIADADAVADALCAGSTGTTFPAAMGGTYFLTPGVYRTAGSLSLGAADTVNFNGAGDYTIIVQGDLDVAATTAFTLGVTDEANITWVVCGDGVDTTGVTLNGGTFPGRVVSAEDILVSAAANVNGKLIATGSATAAGNVTFQVPGAGDTTTVTDAGTPPAVQVSSASLAPVNSALPALAGAGTVASPYIITVGQTLSYSVSANDPDVDPVTLDSAGDAGLTGYVETDNDGNALPVTNLMAFANVSYTPTNADAGDHTITYTATDAQGGVASASVTIHVNLAPTSLGTSNVSGEAPFFAGTTAGTAASPFVACVNDTLTFDVTATDPDFANDGLGSNTSTLDVAGETASFSFSPALPTTEGDGSITTTVTYNPTVADGGSTQTLTFTFTDEFGATTTQDVVIFTSSLPTFSAPFTEPGGAIITACVGQPVQFDVNTTDPDTTIPGTPPTPETVALYVEGTPVGAEHNPNFLGTDSVGPDNDSDGTGGDLLLTGDEDEDGNPTNQTSRFEWTPIAGDEGTYLLTYTAEDAAGCTTVTTVTVIVTNAPTVSATSGGNPVTAGQVLTVCPDQTLNVPVTAVDADGDVIALTATGAPAGSFTPVTGVSPQTSTLSFTPTAGQAGQTFNVVVSATDVTSASNVVGAPGVSQCDPTATLAFTIQVANVPQFTVTAAPGTTLTGGNTANVCVGQAVNFRVRATDADAGNITLTQTSGLPATAFTPGLPTSGNPVETNVSYTPTASGTNVITFTATDPTGCATSTTVTINASAIPTLSIGSVSGAQSGTGTEANPYVVCATPAVPFTFTVTGADSDLANTVTLTHTGALPGATFTTPAGTNPVTQTVSFSPTAGQGGQTFAVTFTATDNSGAPCSVSQTVNIRVTSLPVLTITPSTLTVCEGEAINYRVRATDAEAGNVTIGVPTITNNGGGEGQPVAPALTLVNTPTLPTTGNPVETVVTGSAPLVAADVTYTVTYTATDSDGCTTTQAITITVLNSSPATVQLSRVGGEVFGEQICYTAVVFDNCPAENGGPRRLSGIQVCFNVVGTTGNDGQFFATTNANGEAVFCLTPVFPGTLTVTAAIDQNGDCIADAGTTTGTDNVTVPAPVPNGSGTYITGQGKVDGSDPVFGTAPVIAQFSLDISPKANGTFKGKVNVLIPGAGTLPNGKLTNVKINTTRIESVTVTDTEQGRRGLIFGVVKISGLSAAGLNGTHRFRADAFDGGTPGIPNDSITMTILDEAGGVAIGPFGGTLGFGRGATNPKDDIKIRSGIRGR